MTETLDLQQVIKTSTANVSLDTLTRKGFTQVRVLNQANITRLIGEAVDRVLLERAKKIGKAERIKVIKEARDQFESLARERIEKERGRIEELEAANQALSTELDTVTKRLAATVEVQAERDQAFTRVKGLEEAAERLKSAVPELQRGIEKSNADVRRLQAESDSLRQAATESEKRAALLEGQLAAKTEELEQAKSSVPDPQVGKLLQAVHERLDQVAQPTDVSQIMLSLDGLSRRMANMGRGGGRDMGGDLSSDFALNRLFDSEKEGGVESNINNVQVKQAKAKDVKGALAKLKQLQKGVTDGE
jgi:chromosome segregation ATPase